MLILYASYAVHFASLVYIVGTAIATGCCIWCMLPGFLLFNALFYITVRVFIMFHYFYEAL